LKLSKASALAPSSWIALLAATSLGLSNVHCVRTTIASRSIAPDLLHGACRLIVQSYAPGAVAADQIAAGARPLASAQRSITSEELRQGVQIDLLHVDGEARAEEAHVVAWVEQGEPDLEFDARTARPGAGSMFGQGDTGSTHATGHVWLQPFRDRSAS